MRIYYCSSFVCANNDSSSSSSSTTSEITDAGHQKNLCTMWELNREEKREIEKRTSKWRKVEKQTHKQKI